MEFQLKERKESVRSFKIEEDGLLYVSGEGLFFKNSLIAKGIDQTIYTLHDGLLVYQKRETTYLGDKTLDKSIVIDSLKGDTALFSSELSLEDFSLKYELLNVKDLIVILDFGHLPIIKSILREDGEIYFHFDEKLICVDLSNHKINWELKISVSRILGVYQTQLLLACSDHLLLSVDVNTGEILRKWRELPGFEAGQSYKNVLPEPGDFVLDKEAGKLIGVFSKYYFEIDLTSGEVSYEDIRQELNTHDINSFRRMGNNPFTKDHLFVTAHADLDERPNVDLDCVLALNRSTRKVDWVHIFRDTGLGTNVPQITSTHLYQLDTEKNLYVFEQIS